MTQYLNAWYSRISLGFAFFGAIVVGLWPDHERGWDGEKLIACVITGLAWIASELSTAKKPATSHDIALFDQIREVLNENAQSFLRTHDFSINLHTRFTAPINNIASWHGSNYIFDDAKIQKKWSALFDEIVGLSELYGATLVGVNGEGMLSAWLTGMSRHEQPQSARDEVDALNAAANSVYNHYGEFVLFARKRLSV